MQSVGVSVRLHGMHDVHVSLAPEGALLPQTVKLVWSVARFSWPVLPRRGLSCLAWYNTHDVCVMQRIM